MARPGLLLPAKHDDYVAQVRDESRRLAPNTVEVQHFAGLWFTENSSDSRVRRGPVHSDRLLHGSKVHAFWV